MRINETARIKRYIISALRLRVDTSLAINRSLSR